MARLLMLVDGDALLYRAANDIPYFTHDRGLPTNGLHGFASMMWRLRQSFQPSHMAVAFTAAPPLVKHSEDIKRQLPYAVRFVRALGVQAFLEPGYEADDVVATLVRHAGRLPVRIVSQDRDFYQLVTDRVQVLRPVRGVSELQTIGLVGVEAAFGVAPAQVLDVDDARRDNCHRRDDILRGRGAIPGRCGIVAGRGRGHEPRVSMRRAVAGLEIGVAPRGGEHRGQIYDTACR